MNKVLILTVTAGEGHNSTARAVKAELDSRGIENEILDVYLTINKGLYNMVSKGYLISINELKKIYSKAYHMCEIRKGNSFTHSTTRMTNRMIGKKIHDFIKEYDPDIIVYTHVFIGPLLDVIRQRHGLRAKTIGVVTDFVMHPFWEDALRMDYIVLASEMLIPAARRKGFTREQILTTGIPINPKFALSRPKEEARAELGLPMNTNTVLLMGGGMGYGGMTSTIEALDRSELDFQIIAVCGSNAAARDEISRMKTAKRVLNLGYVNNVELLMDASDCIVTKPGGLTSSEALAKRLPMIIINPIPGQEDRNTEFLRNAGTAVSLSPAYTIADAVNQLFTFRERLELMRASIDLIRKPNSTVDIADFIERLFEEQNGRE